MYSLCTALAQEYKEVIAFIRCACMHAAAQLRAAKYGWGDRQQWLDEVHVTAFEQKVK